MWTIHRVASNGDDLVIYANDIEGRRTPPGIVQMAAERVTSADLGIHIPTTKKVSPRRLTAMEQHREEHDVARREKLLTTLAAEARGTVRTSYRYLLGILACCRRTTSYAAMDFPGCGCGINSMIDVHLLLEGG